MKKIFFLLISMILLSCQQHSVNTDNFQIDTNVYGGNKIWAHKANDTLAAQAKSCQFGGLEVDITYSAYQNQLFVGHELSDSTDGLTLSMWYHAIANRETCRFWFDIKNLSADNADSICALIENLSATIKKRAFIESQSDEALLKVKNQGFMTLFWVNNPYWDGESVEEWTAKIKNKIAVLQPSALSSWYQMYPLLSDSFPDMAIHYWHTPMEYSQKNAAFTRELCQPQNVAVVLVDYDSPIDY